MQFFAYMSAKDGYLLEHWMHTLPEGAALHILCDPEGVEVATALRERHPLVQGIHALGDPSNPQKIAAIRNSTGTEEITLAREYPPRELQFVPGVHLANIQSDYSLIRQLWQFAFRRFHLHNLQGGQVFQIPQLLDQYAGAHAGKRCFVVGNGPSLNDIDMTLLKDEITLGSNRCYLGYEKWGFPLTYWGIMDRLQIEEYRAEYEQNVPRETPKFFPFEYAPLFRFDNACPVNFSYDSRPPFRFSDSPDILHLGFTVTHMLLQIAAIMGCNPIYLVGVDHSYGLNSTGESPKSPAETAALLGRVGRRARRAAAGAAFACYKKIAGPDARELQPSTTKASPFPKSRLWIAADTKQATHFTENYTDGPKRFVKPRPEMQEACFAVAAEWAEANGVQILNATPNSKLPNFPLVDYGGLF